MKCPLRYNVWVDKENKPILLDQDCLKEECAWWEEHGGFCAILKISRHLKEIEGDLDSINNVMPARMRA